MRNDTKEKVELSEAYVLPALNGTLDAVRGEETLADLVVVLVGDAPEGPGGKGVRGMKRGNIGEAHNPHGDQIRRNQGQKKE